MYPNKYQTITSLPAPYTKPVPEAAGEANDPTVVVAAMTIEVEMKPYG